jgi:cytochrome c oxidase subunit 2
MNSNFGGTLPLVATDVAGQWDTLYKFLVWISVFFFVLVVGAMLYFAVKYRHTANRKTKYITGSHLLEGVFIVVPTVLLLVIFGWGYSVYRGMTQAPSDAYQIRVIGKQWLWQFQYDNGKTTVGELYVPLNKPVRLLMTSEDVLHDFFIPNFRVKQDVVPGMYSSVWFEAKIPGRHQVFCAEYCGTSHSQMLAQLIVLDDQQWEAFQSGKKIAEQPKAGDLAENGAVAGDAVRAGQASPERPALRLASLSMQGKGVFETKGCVACHSTDGTSKIGPSVKNLFGSHTQLMDGTQALADENYLRESIEQPQAKLVKGYGPVMPTFKGLISETEMNAVIAYMKSLSSTTTLTSKAVSQRPLARPATLAQ